MATLTSLSSLDTLYGSEDVYYFLGDNFYLPSYISYDEFLQHYWVGSFPTTVEAGAYLAEEFYDTAPESYSAFFESVSQDFTVIDDNTNFHIMHPIGNE